MTRLRGKVAVVTGASRGVGRGIARVLGDEGATVYITGRTTRADGSPTGRLETIDETAEQVRDRGGECIPIRCDHADDDQVRALFARIETERGRLDILVANAWGGYERQLPDQPVWELDPAHLDLMIRSGLRSHILTTQFATSLLRATAGGLVVLTSWAIGIGRPLDRQGRPAYHRHLYYDVIKTAMNRIPVGLAEELRPYDVAALAVSPGPMHDTYVDTTSDWAKITESTEFTGRAIAALAADPDVIRHSGSLFTVVDLADEYGFTDVNGQSTSAKWEGYRRGRRDGA